MVTVNVPAPAEGEDDVRFSNRREVSMFPNRSLGVIFLALYLLLVAIVALTNIHVVAMTIVMGVVALLASIFLVLGK